MRTQCYHAHMVSSARPRHKGDGSINDNTVKISVRLQKETHASAKVAAIEDGTDLMSWVEALIVRALQRRER